MHVAFMDHRLDQTLLDEFLDGAASQAAVDLVVFNQGVDGDNLHFLGNFLDDLVKQGIVEHDSVVLLVAYLTLGPLYVGENIIRIDQDGR